MAATERRLCQTLRLACSVLRPFSDVPPTGGGGPHPALRLIPLLDEFLAWRAERLENRTLHPVATATRALLLASVSCWGLAGPAMRLSSSCPVASGLRESAVSGSDPPGPHPGRSLSSNATTRGCTGGRWRIRPIERDLSCHLPYGKATGTASRVVLSPSPARAHHAPWRTLQWASHLVAVPALRAVAAVPAREAAADVRAAVAAPAAVAVLAGGRRLRATRPAVVGTTIRPGAERCCSA